MELRQQHATQQQMKQRNLVLTLGRNMAKSMCKEQDRQQLGMIFYQKLRTTLF